ncbi:MAG TPA: DNA alkylation repair protein, partial [Candidatus Acidoferrales bacterium]|nr:DNA alkylation repair protein [Candidatus Acidoferrales bacterium]
MENTTARPKVIGVLARLKSLGDPANVAGMARFGVVAKKAYGVCTPALRKLAREIGRDQRLSLQLWATSIHDARHLAALVGEPARVTPAQMERWARDFDSWDVVDGCCCHLFVYTPHAWRMALAWSRREEEFIKRAGFSLMAYLAVRDKQAADEKFLRLLPVIERASFDERHFVKKAVNWALRQIGKRNARLNCAAIASGKKIRAYDQPAARW